LVGLRRRGFGAEALRALREAYRVLLQSRLPLADALSRLESEGPHTDEVRTVVAFIRGSTRGVVLSRRRGRGSEPVEP
ncbi:MAG TPA: hypothetical protein VEQ10_17940, partial [Vicinamibacteria bacterium]|nr:hypothetical protein [Vicinamibacteria bacterium]